MFEQGDLYLNYMRGGPGFGDPLDRLPTLVEDDVNNFRVSPRCAEQVYGVVMVKNGDGSWHVDGGKATADRRAQIKQERIARAVPTRTWMEQERQRVLGKEATFQVQQMFASSFGLSPAFLAEFKTFWDLPDDWQLTEEELDGSHKIVDKCALPLTGRRVVQRIITDLAVIDVTPGGLELRELAPEVTADEIRAKSGAELHLRDDADGVLRPVGHVRSRTP